VVVADADFRVNFRPLAVIRPVCVLLRVFVGPRLPPQALILTKKMFDFPPVFLIGRDGP